MKNIYVTVTVFVFLVFSPFVVFAETPCQRINITGNVINADQFAITMNKWLALKEINYKTTSKEMTNTLKDFCKSHPYGTADDVTNHLQNIVDVIAATEN